MSIMNFLARIPVGKGEVQFILPAEELDEESLSAIRQLLEAGDVRSLDNSRRAMLEPGSFSIWEDDGDDHYIVNFRLRCYRINSANDIDLLEVIKRE